MGLWFYLVQLTFPMLQPSKAYRKRLWVRDQCWNPVTWVDPGQSVLSTKSLCWVWAALGAETWISAVSTRKVEKTPKAHE